MKIKEIIFDVETEKTIEIERDLDAAEIAVIEENKKRVQLKNEELLEKEAHRKTLLEKLGITEEEARLLLG